MRSIKSARELFNKERFRKNHATKVKADFEELYKLFKDCNLVFERIGKMLGISKQRVHQLFRKYFSGLPGTENRDHLFRHLRIVKEREKSLTSLSTGLSSVDVLEEVVIEAVKLGLTFRRIPIPDKQELSSHPSTRPKALEINGQPCLIKVARFVTHHNPNSKYCRFYGRLRRLKDYSFIVGVQSIPGSPKSFFIIPTDVIRSCNNGEYYCIYVNFSFGKVRRSVYERKENWNRFKNAWDLLKQTKTAA